MQKTSTIELNHSTNSLVLSGGWDFMNLDNTLLEQIRTFDVQAKSKLHIDATKITHLDLGGAYFIAKIMQNLRNSGIESITYSFNPTAQVVFDKVYALSNLPQKIAKQEASNPNIVMKLGGLITNLFTVMLELTEFLGYICVSLFMLIRERRGLNLSSVKETVMHAGIQGIFISAALCFLIGVNLTYQMSPQFVSYGANIYIVNFLGIALLREVTPLLTAIIIAGRTGSAITATIGTMQAQEEIDALRVMGISPIRRLVIPRLIGLLFALPILTIIADIASMLGGMLVAKSYLGISYSLFMERLQTYVSISNYSLGIIKSFAFAWIIAMVGSFCGFKTKSSAESVGIQTTKSVVLSICLIIFVDAIFAIMFKNIGV